MTAVHDRFAKMTVADLWNRTCRALVPKGVQLRWEEARINRIFRKSLAEAEKKKNNDQVELLEHQHGYELRFIHEEQEQLYTSQLVNKASRLRVPIPPRLTGTKEGYEPSEDWFKGTMDEWWLSPTGIAKLREEIRKEEKWRREGRAHWAVILSAIAGLVGTITGLVAVLVK